MARLNLLNITDMHKVFIYRDKKIIKTPEHIESVFNPFSKYKWIRADYVHKNSKIRGFANYHLHYKSLKELLSCLNFQSQKKMMDPGIINTFRSSSIPYQYEVFDGVEFFVKDTDGVMDDIASRSEQKSNPITQLLDWNSDEWTARKYAEYIDAMKKLPYIVVHNIPGGYRLEIDNYQAEIKWFNGEANKEMLHFITSVKGKLEDQYTSGFAVYEYGDLSWFSYKTRSPNAIFKGIKLPPKHNEIIEVRRQQEKNLKDNVWRNWKSRSAWRNYVP